MARWLRRTLGGGLLALCLLPFHRLLDPGRIGAFGEDVRELAEINQGWTWWGIVTVGVAGALVASLTTGDRIREGLRRVGRALAAPRPGTYALGLALTSGALALLASRLLFHGLPTGVDEMASLVQARYLAEGWAGGPTPDPPRAWVFLNTVLTPQGWVSLYPPSHLVILGTGIRLGILGLVPPLLVATTVGAGALSAEWLLGPERLSEARLGSLLLALSPFLVILGGSYLSHVSAAAFGAMALAFALQARARGWRWAAAAGASMGLMVTSRPWTGLVLGSALTAGVWVADAWRRRRARGWILARILAWAGGGLPLAVAWLAYNRHFFGNPLRTGYTWAYGAAHGLGFHRDPWGNLYGPVEALGFSAAQVAALGINLLETPLPVVVLVGLWLVAVRRLPRGAGPLLAWATLPVAANALYWHHGFHLGPRMLYEAAPAWAFLTALAAVGLARRPQPPEMGEADSLPSTPPASDPGEPERRLRIPAPRDVVLWALVLSAVAAPWLAVQRAASRAHTPDALARFAAPAVPGPRPPLVFVHGSWGERLSGRLQADGMTLDSVETVLRRNAVCRVQAYVTARVEEERPPSELPTLDLRPLPGSPPHLRPVFLSPGNRVMVGPEGLDELRCRREARADRNGVLSHGPLVWQGALPGLREDHPMFVRDLGPEENRGTLSAHPDRRAWMYFTPDTLSPPVLRPYEEGMARIWESPVSGSGGR